MKNKLGNMLGACVVALLLIVGLATFGKSAISELAGLAVAQSTTQWNSVADAGKGDGLSTGILASSTYLFNGLTFDRLRGTPGSDGSSGTGFLAQVNMVYNGTTYDRLRGGITADSTAVTGLLNNAQLVFNGSSYDRVREPTTDSMAVTGLTANANQVFNGSTWDRLRSASADNLSATGIGSSGNVGFDGSTWDRLISISNTNNTAVTSQGVKYSTPLSTWSVTNTQSGAVQATASKAAGGGTVRHVATGITICRGDTAVAAPVLIHLRDGASGAGTILRSWVIGIDTVNGSKCENVTGLNMTGSANTAMTLEFAAAGSATSISTVTLTGYSTP